MQIALSKEQRQAFRNSKAVSFEMLLTQEERVQLKKALKKAQKETPGYPPENLAQSIPLLVTLAKKAKCGQIAAALLDKKPIRLAYDAFYEKEPRCELYEDEIGLLIPLDGGNLLFFQEELPEKAALLRNVWLLVLTADHLNENLHPVLLR